MRKAKVNDKIKKMLEEKYPDKKIEFRKNNKGITIAYWKDYISGEVKAGDHIETVGKYGPVETATKDEHPIAIISNCTDDILDLRGLRYQEVNCALGDGLLLNENGEEITEISGVRVSDSGIEVLGYKEKIPLECSKLYIHVFFPDKFTQKEIERIAENNKDIKIEVKDFANRIKKAFSKEEEKIEK